MALIDLVSSGGTFGWLTRFLLEWTRKEKLDQNAIKHKLRLLGFTERTKNSPNTYRWQQKADWVDELGPLNIKNISIPYRLWTYLGNFQVKTNPTNPPSSWGDPALSKPIHRAGPLNALRQAYDIFQHGSQPEVRQAFCKLLNQETSVREAWFRSLVGEIKNSV